MLESSGRILERKKEKRNGPDQNSWCSLNGQEWTLTPTPPLKLDLGQCGPQCDMTRVTPKLS